MCCVVRVVVCVVLRALCAALKEALLSPRRVENVDRALLIDFTGHAYRWDSSLLCSKRRREWRDKHVAIEGCTDFRILS